MHGQNHIKFQNLLFDKQFRNAMNVFSTKLLK